METKHLQIVDERYMRRCLELAKKGLGYTYPNPLVGAVIVNEKNIIGEGWHQAAGQPHAEINAIRQVQNRELLSNSTLYVNLEPCCHFGKTPPCVNAIIENKIPRVVVGMKDPHDKVAGKGIEKLRENGCQVRVGVLSELANALNKRFICFHKKKRPYIILKWAASQDGFIAPENNKRKPGIIHWITGIHAKQCVHKWRSEENAILVGVQTVIEDNPALTTRNWEGHHPKRYVIDPNGRMPLNSELWTDSFPVSVLSHAMHVSQNDCKVVTAMEDFEIKTILNRLYKDEIQSIIVEGGAKTIQYFINAAVWDEARVFNSKSHLESGTPAPKLKGKIVEKTTIGRDELTVYHPNF